MAELCGDELAWCVCTNEKGTCSGMHRCTNDGCQGSWNDDKRPLTDPITGESFDEFMKRWKGDY